MASYIHSNVFVSNFDWRSRLKSAITLTLITLRLSDIDSA
jgi:hypothetical protein